MENYSKKVGDITYKSELTLDIFDVKGSIRTNRVAKLGRTILDIFNVKYRVLIEGAIYD